MSITRLCIFFKTLTNMAPSYYAVAKGHKPGIYSTWDECKTQIHQYPGAAFKKFKLQTEAENFIKEKRGPIKESNSNNTIPTEKRRRALRRKAPPIVNNKQSNPKKCKVIDLESECVQRKKLSDYIMDDNGYVNVYTDGACSSNGRRNARAGIGVWFGDGHPMNISQPVVGRATNNMAEIQAVTAAAKLAKQVGIKKLKIHTDSQFLIKCITRWLPKWKKNGWKTVDKKPVINKIELLEMEEALASLNVIWKHVNGHVGIYGNEMADRLAKAGSLKY
ncbi:ribonuclease H1 isoform X2 [Colletes gigas]|uniref:ribonuclease H1 isoform X2 n=1 Tax=Colletes gigas TaxID=935657 RepID=UPI001C9A6F24|nr:ribonuclease H1 isoform X2 [Colletes gigas]